MSHSTDRRILVTVDSPLGWMALIGQGNTLRQLTIAHRSAKAAVAALDAELRLLADGGRWNDPFVERLKAFVDGEPVDFDDVQIDLDNLSEFRRRVLRQCRRIRYGQTLTYGQLAAKAGSAGAARAVGNCMAANRFPLVVPCHRVVAAGGRLGAFSAPGGTRTKRRLLTLEGWGE